MVKPPKATVYRLTKATLACDAPLADVVGLARAVYRQALRGEIIGLGVCYVTGANDTVTNWAPGCASSDLMTASASKLSYRIVKAANGD